MRMWMVDPKTMCTRHLLGEHHEIHMFAGALKRQTSVTGYIENNLLEPRSIKKRHDELVTEMERRGFAGHKSPMEQPDISYLPLNEQRARVDVESAAKDLFSRCQLCDSVDGTIKDCPL